ASDTPSTSTHQALSVDSVVEGLLPLLSRKEFDIKLRAMIAEGLAKLLHSDRVNHPQVLAELLLMYFDETWTTLAPQLQQCLTIFLPVYATAHPTRQASMAAALLPALQK